MGCLVGVKSKDRMMVFDRSYVNKEFYKNVDVDVEKVSYPTVDVNSGGYMSYSKKNLQLAIDCVGNSEKSPNSEFFSNCLGMIFSVAFRGVLFPDFRDFIASQLGSSGVNCCAAPEGLVDIVKAWEDISRRLFEGTEYFSINKVEFEMIYIASFVEVVQTPAEFVECKKYVDHREETQIRKEVKNFLARVRNFDKPEKEAAEEAFAAAKAGVSKWEFFERLKQRKCSVSVVVVAEKAWYLSKKLHG